MKKFSLTLYIFLLFTATCLFGQELNYLAEGNAFFQNREYKKAKESYKKALKETEESLPALRALCDVEVKLEDWGDLNDWSNKILKLQPEDTGANYHKGIAHRETGKFKALLLRKIDFGKSEKYFDAAIERDSLYKDVLLQRGLLERRRENWQDAILYGQRQVKIKPHLPEAQVGLFKLYRLYLINGGDKNRILNWLKNLKNDWSEYFAGEFFRRYGNPGLADSIFQNMLQRDLSISRIPIYIALVRLNLKLQNADRANNYYYKALDAIQSKTDALFLFEDIKYILTGDEYNRFLSINEAESYKPFFERFWLKRELVPAADVSYRLLEHYRRLLVAETQFWYDGVRSRVNNPDRFGHIDFPAYYELNDEFNDKGLIFIRHGDPNDVARTLGESTILNESWLYYERDDRDKLVFHFLVSEHSTGNNWRLSSALDDRKMLEDRLGWDQSIHNVYYAKSELDFFSKLNLMASQGMVDAEKAMASDYHTWSNKIVPLSSNHHFACFMGDSGKTEARVYIALPLNREGNHVEVDSQKVEIGSAIVDKDYAHRFKKSDSTSLAAERSAIYEDYYMKDYSFTLAPGAYNLSYFIKSGNKLGGENTGVEVPAFSATGLEISSIVPAFWIEMPGDASQESSILKVTPNPSKKFGLADPVFLYYELYNLKQNEAGETDYAIETELAQAEKKSNIKNLFGLFGSGGKKVVSLNDRRTGEKANVHESISFDVSNLDKGDYELKIKVVDNVSQQSAVESIPIYLVEED